MPLFVVKLFQEMHFRDILCRNFLADDHTLYTILWVTTAHFLFGMFSSQSVGMFWGILGTNDDQITEMNE